VHGSQIKVKAIVPLGQFLVQVDEYKKYGELQALHCEAKSPAHVSHPS